MNWSKSNFNRLRQLYSKDETLLDRFHQEAKMIGTCTSEIVTFIRNQHIFEAESEICSLIRYGSVLGDERLEAACNRVLFYGLSSSDMVKKVLIYNLDSLPLDPHSDIYGQPFLPF
jgi:hypothetical protein